MNPNELKRIAALIDYLNANLMPPDSEMDAEVTLIDSNADVLGAIKYDPTEQGYAFLPASR